MTSGSSLERSVLRVQLEASTVSDPVLVSSRFPPTIPRALHGSGVDGAWIDS
jgi:hypothetical protein